MSKWLALAAAGALGTLARYALSGWVHRHVRETFPAGTLVVNVAGCFLIGLVMQASLDRQVLAPEARTVVVAGFLGAFTTFSAFGYETIELMRGGSPWPALASVAGNLALGLAAVVLGAACARVAGT